MKRDSMRKQSWKAELDYPIVQLRWHDAGGGTLEFFPLSSRSGWHLLRGFLTCERYGDLLSVGPLPSRPHDLSGPSNLGSTPHLP
jgi:hypothetical protein